MSIKTILPLSVLLATSFICFSQDGRVIETELYNSTTSEKAKKLYNLAQNNFENGNYAKAVEQYKLSIAEDSNYIEAYDNLGLAFRKMNLLDSAERYYLISHKKYPKGTTSLQNLAVVEQLRGNFEKAITYFNLMIGLEPENPESYYGLCLVYYRLGKNEEAIKNALLAEKYYKVSGSPYIGDAYHVLCVLYFTLNDKVNTKKYYELCKMAGVKVDSRIEEAMKKP